MALIVDRSPYDDMDDEAADDALQVVDLDDIVVSTITAPEHELELVSGERRRRLSLRYVSRLVLAFVAGLALSVPMVAVVRLFQDDDRSDVDIEDGRRELPADLQPPIRDDDPPVPDVTTTTTPTTTAATPPVDADPGGKAAFKAAAPTTPPSTAGTATTVPATTTSSTAPPTTASPTTSTPSPTLPDGSPNPLGPGPLGPPTGPTTTAPDPWGSDIIPGG
jgi:hypothetical protein